MYIIVYIYITLISLNLTYHTRRVVTNYCAQRYWYCYAPIVLLPWCWLPWWLSFCRPTQTPVMMSLIERPLQRRSWHSAGEHPLFDPPIIFTITYIQRWLWWLSHIFPWTLPIFPWKITLGPGPGLYRSTFKLDDKYHMDNWIIDI